MDLALQNALKRYHGGVAATGHTPTPSCFRATFREGGGGGGGVGLVGRLGLVGGWPTRGGGGAPDPYIYALKWPSHRADDLELQI